jgi:hypothetical protein
MTSPAIKEDAMRLSRVQRGRFWTVLAGTLWLAGAAQPASAQTPLFGARYHDAYAPYPQQCVPSPLGPPVALPPGAPSTAPGAAPTAPGAAPGAAPTTPGTETTAPAPGELAATDTGATPEASAAGGGESFAAAQGGVGGYIDSAIPRTMFRLRFDAANNDNRPDRAEFFYAKCGCFRTAAPPLNDPKAAGPGPNTETSVDYQELNAYFEVAVNPHLSVFLEVPYRWLESQQNADHNGFSDLIAGFKYAFIACDDTYLTFQLKVYTPTGDSFRGLGTDHTSVEPALLWQTRARERWTFFGELREWVATDGSDFAGNVLRVGLGVGYDVYRSCSWTITPVLEGVSWTVLGGKESFLGTPPIESAVGDEIINVKLGVRAYYGEHSSLYVGYGRALTGEVWYKDIWRVEYRLSF